MYNFKTETIEDINNYERATKVSLRFHLCNCFLMKEELPGHQWVLCLSSNPTKRKKTIVTFRITQQIINSLIKTKKTPQPNKIPLPASHPYSDYFSSKNSGTTESEHFVTSFKHIWTGSWHLQWFTRRKVNTCLFVKLSLLLCTQHHNFDFYSFKRNKEYVLKLSVIW